MKILMHESADFEVIQAAKWLDNNADGLGEEFLCASQAMFESIADNPFQFFPATGSRHQDQLRVALVKRFNYSIYFRIFENTSTVWVVAVQHTSREPRQWSDRFGDIDLANE